MFDFLFGKKLYDGVSFNKPAILNIECFNMIADWQREKQKKGRYGSLLSLSCLTKKRRKKEISARPPSVTLLAAAMIVVA